MKKILLIINFIVTVSLYSQSQKKSYTYELKPSYLDSIGIETSTSRDLKLINYFDLNSLINLFFDDFEYFKSKYLQCNIIPKQYTEKLDDYLFKIKNNSTWFVDFDLDEDGVLGLSKSRNDDSKITVTVNPKLWKLSSNPHRLYIMYHELGHDILNFKHGEGGKMMFTNSERNYNYSEFYTHRENMFRIFLDKFFKDLGYDEIILNERCFNIPKYGVQLDNKKFKYFNKLFTGKILINSNLITINNGLLDGIIYQNPNNKKFPTEICFIKGKLIDETYFFDNGNIKSHSVRYDDFVLSVDYYKNGQISKFEGYPQLYKENLVFPIYYYYNNGNIKEIKYIKDVIPKFLNKRITYFENGNVKSFQNYNDEKNENVLLYYNEKGGLRNGNFTTYYSNGNIESEGYYKDGRCIGSEKWYYDSEFLYLIHLEEGRMIFLRPNIDDPPTMYSLRNGILDGVFYSYDYKNGYKSSVYTNGVLKSGHEIDVFGFNFMMEYILFEFIH